MKRQAWLDYMKFIAMSLVVFHHTPPRYNPAHEVGLIYVGMPMFFFAAGYLFKVAKEQDFFTFLRHRARKILIPYTTFFVVFYALWLVMGRRMAGPEEMAIDPLLPLWQFISGQPDVVVAPFWFLATMFTMQLIYYPIRRYLSGYWPFVVSLLLCLSLLVLPDVDWMRYWNFDRALLYMPLYAFGNCFKDLVNRFAFSSGSKPLAVAGEGQETLNPPCPLPLWLMLVCATVSMAFLIIAPVSMEPGLAYVLAPEAAILFIPLYVALCKWLEARFGPSRVARNVAITGITFLGLQNYLIGIFKMLVAKLFGPGAMDETILWKFAIALVVMMILYPLALFVDRYLPWMLGNPYKKNGR